MNNDLNTGVLLAEIDPTIVMVGNDQPSDPAENGPTTVMADDVQPATPAVAEAEDTEAQAGGSDGGAAHEVAHTVPQINWDMPVNPVANLFPLIPDNKLDDLVADIKEHGLIHDIVVHEGEIVDGRNRLIACREAGVVPRFVKWRDAYNGPMSLSQWIWSINGQRRHLSAGQIAGILVKLRGFDETEAARRRRIDAGRQQGERGREGGRGRVKPLQTISSEGVSSAMASDQVGDATGPDQPESATVKPKKDSSGNVRARLAREGNFSEHIAQQALNVEKANPALLTEVIQGKRELCDAAKEVKGDTAAARAETGGGRGSAKPNAASTFDPEHRISTVVRTADQEIEDLSEERRNIVLRGIIDELTRML